jgi:hypothetical protein
MNCPLPPHREQVCSRLVETRQIPPSVHSFAEPPRPNDPQAAAANRPCSISRSTASVRAPVYGPICCGTQHAEKTVCRAHADGFFSIASLREIST